MKKKTWTRKNIVRTCGYCEMCKKECMSNEGGWIVNAEHKFFCHTYNGKPSCFDNYIKASQEVAF
jgi:hypothetical protein